MPDSNQVWDTWRDRWLTTWGRHKVLSEPSMFWVATDAGIARMEVGNGDPLVMASGYATLEALSRSLVTTWKLEITKFRPEAPMRLRFHMFPKQRMMDQCRPSIDNPSPVIMRIPTHYFGKRCRCRANERRALRKPFR